MKRLKKRTRSDTHISEARRPRPRTWDRNVYLALLVVFFGGLGNYIFGDRLFLRADGLVLLDRTVIEATERVEITEVTVRPGQSVKAGQDLIRAESLETLGRLAELAMKEAEMAERGARLRSELQMARELAPRAERYLDELGRRRETLAQLDQSNLVSVTRREEMADSFYEADIRAASLSAQISGLASEIGALDDTRKRALDAIQSLKAHYREGRHAASTAGIVGDRVPAPGEVFNPGEPMLTLYRGEPYVLAYLPQGYLFDLSIGEVVTVTAGKLSRAGRIEAILPVSATIPNEVRNAFRLRETRQLARVALDPGPALPTMAAVQITQGWNVQDSARRLMRRFDGTRKALLDALDVASL